MKIIERPSIIEAAGYPPKRIEEYFGNVNTGTKEISIARMVSPPGWNEPGQTPEFDEYTIVLKGTLQIETTEGIIKLNEGNAVVVPRNSWVRYSTPDDQGAEYIAVCLPAFSPEIVKRDKE